MKLAAAILLAVTAAHAQAPSDQDVRLGWKTCLDHEVAARHSPADRTWLVSHAASCASIRAEDLRRRAVRESVKPAEPDVDSIAGKLKK